MEWVKGTDVCQLGNPESSLTNIAHQEPPSIMLGNRICCHTICKFIWDIYSPSIYTLFQLTTICIHYLYYSTIIELRQLQQLKLPYIMAGQTSTKDELSSSTTHVKRVAIVGVRSKQTPSFSVHLLTTSRLPGNWGGTSPRKSSRPIGIPSPHLPVREAIPNFLKVSKPLSWTMMTKNQSFPR